MMSTVFEDLTIPLDIGEITSGHITIIGSISGQMVVITSGAFGSVITDVSGQTVKLESGTTIQLPTTQIVKISGDTVSITSGQIVQLPATQVVKVSGETVFVKGSGEWFEVHVLSGGEPVGTVTTDVSGQTVITAKYGTAFILFSGYGTTNTIVVSGFGFLQHEAATIGFTNLGEGSGINYNVKGYVVSGIMPQYLTSGTIYSGDVVAETISDPYSWVEVGVDSKQDDFSGLVTITAARR